MKKIFYLMLFISFVFCNSGESQNSNNGMTDQSKLNNVKIKDYAFLDCMYQDSYFPKFLVDKSKNILLELCLEIETKKPDNLAELYKLTHAATYKLNDLEDEFSENDSEIETGARECLGMDFEYVAKSYGFEADIEELIAPRNW
jgi:hypothetical protein